mmetsp:Transcript_14239/g.37656  ORF Transcript_14239/g.37656 Transcript_14239/m.37656 type:complete len:141 (-) Transcript_14239:1630-2052(-)
MFSMIPVKSCRQPIDFKSTLCTWFDWISASGQFKERVTEMSISSGHLVVVTATQVCIYTTSNWNTPHIIELRGTVSLILQVKGRETKCQRPLFPGYVRCYDVLFGQAERHFAMVDTINGFQILNFDGRLLSQVHSCLSRL